MNVASTCPSCFGLPAPMALMQRRVDHSPVRRGSGRYDPQKLGDENVTDDCRRMWVEEEAKLNRHKTAGSPAKENLP